MSGMSGNFPDTIPDRILQVHTAAVQTFSEYFRTISEILRRNSDHSQRALQNAEKSFEMASERL